MSKTKSKQIRMLEEICANAHVALNCMHYDGWILRFSNGHTSRANSISVIYPSTIDIHRKILYCEECYQKQNLPCTFKITDSKKDTKLNKILQKSGYQEVNATHLMIRNLSDFYTEQDKTNPEIKVTFSDLPSQDWLKAYFEYEEINNIETQNTYLEMLKKVNIKTIYAAVVLNEKIVACASAAIEHGYMLLQNVIVSKDFRGKGFGNIVCQSLIAKAKQEGADNAFLQVLTKNEKAINLYTKLGFKKLYSYWYMQR